jgi:hypothetical protein
MLSRLGETCDFPLALASLLYPCVDAAVAETLGERWRLSNKESQRVCWLVANHAALLGAQSARWSRLQPLLTAEGVDELLKMTEAGSSDGVEAASYCRSLLAQPPEVLNPPPLLTGNDLLAEGMPSGPEYKTLLQRVRDAQLDGEVCSKAEALAMVEQWRKK